MTQRNSVHLVGKQLEEAGNIFPVEFPSRRKHPQDRTQLAFQRRKSLRDEVTDSFACFCQLWPSDAVARPLYRELEVVGYHLRPASPAFRALPAVEGGVDLDRAQLPRGIFELFGLWHRVRIEHPAPRRVSPAPNSDADARLAHACMKGTRS